jgi:hypothetical protein
MSNLPNIRSYPPGRAALTPTTSNANKPANADIASFVDI